MRPLATYRDDGLLVGVLARGRAPDASSPLAWLLPPAVRAAEYGLVIGLAAGTDRGALPIAFAFLGVLAFHHYDLAYRLRDQGSPPPRWLSLLAGGWDGRIVAVSALAAAGVLGPGLLVAACILGPLFVGESVVSWIRANPASAR